MIKLSHNAALIDDMKDSTKLAHEMCDDLGQYKPSTVVDYFQSTLASNDIGPKTTGALLAAAVTSYCPKYEKALDQYTDGAQ